MSKLHTLIASSLISSFLLVGCGSTASESDGSKTTQAQNLGLDSENYISIAKKLYAKESGKDISVAVKKLPAPGSVLDSKTLYLKRVTKPRDYIVTYIEAVQDKTILTVNVDNDRKYATVKLSGDKEAQKVINMREFTTLLNH